MQRIRRVTVDCLEQGMVLGRTLDAKIGSKLLEKGSKLDKKTIDRLQSMNFEDPIYILEYIEEDTVSTEVRNLPVFDEVLFQFYVQQALEQMQLLTGNVRLERAFRLDNLIETMGMLLQQIYAKGNPLYCMEYIRTQDKYHITHPINVCVLSTLLGEWLYLSDVDRQQLTYSSLLFDLGKSKIPLKILNKPNKLTPEEFEVIKQHPIYSYELVKDWTHFTEAMGYGILMHHEKENGKGYPYGITGEEIHFFAKIIAVSDMYDAITCDRAYSEKISPIRAAETLVQQSFLSVDPEVAQTLLSKFKGFYVGTRVVLNTEVMGKVIYLPPNMATRPLIELEDGKYIDLNKDENRHISIMQLLP